MKTELQTELECCENWMLEYAAHPWVYSYGAVISMLMHVEQLRLMVQHAASVAL
jgi:hypothetical protein